MRTVDRTLLEHLKNYDTATVFNAAAKVQGKAEENYCGPELRYMTPEFGSFIGHVVTVEATPLDPAPPTLSWDAYYDFLNDTPGPIVAALKDVDPRPGRAALFGDGMAHLHKALGVTGAVIDGVARDLVGIRGAGLPIFARGTVPGHGPFHVRRFGEPVVIGQMNVSTGDLLLADTDGIVSIPTGLAEEVLKAAESIRNKEKMIFDYYRSPDFTYEKYKTWVKTLS